MIAVIPIRTESVIRRTPVVNLLLIALNGVAFLLSNGPFAADTVGAFLREHLYLQSHQLAFHQFFTYQFLHADLAHLLGNMLFLWVFGNSVNAKMGHGPYLLFYLAGGVFAAWGYAVSRSHGFFLIGASGSVATVTAAYLALFPRSHVTVLLWIFIVIQFVELPAMLLIGLKVIVWDNIIAPKLGDAQRVAYDAHLAGYLFGFVGALGMLLVRALPRDQFDILAVWRRWHQRHSAGMAMPAGSGAEGDSVLLGHAIAVDPEQRARYAKEQDEIADLRTRIGVELDKGSTSAGAALYEQLVGRNVDQCLSEYQQLAVARAFYGAGQFAPAAAAFSRFVDCYPNSAETSNVRLLLGIIYARDLREFEVADEHLTQSMEALRDETRRHQCLEWLTMVRAALGRPAPQVSSG
jgi:membrane associated rhomboid family serine protease